ncbi:MAG: c-type cytochrome, partial [Planctomycetaceae bacterium]|nr:c-type cytochrome [Planctomycetaceae bacterium]
RTLVLTLILIGIVILQMVVYPTLKNQHVAPELAEWEMDMPLSEIKLEAPAVSDSSIPFIARPEWFVRFLFELRHMVPKELEVLVTAVLPGVLLAILIMVPFYEKFFGEKWGQRLAIAVYVGGLVIISGISWYSVKTERSAPDYALKRSQEIAYAARASWLASENGVPPEGPASLLRNDPKSMGPLIFARHCGICHTWNGHDGTGHYIMEMKDGKKVKATPRASDLAGFATTEWIAEFLMDPKAPKFFGHVGTTKGGDAILNGDMSDWADSNVGPEGVLSKADIEAVAALIAREANHRNAEPLSEAVIKRGVSVFSGMEFKDKAGKVVDFDGYCAQCHAMKAGDPGEEGGGAAPDLNGYGSAKWLSEFIRNPGAEKFYGEKNIMPSFEESKLSQHDLNLLVKWMRGEWQRREVEK